MNFIKFPLPKLASSQLNLKLFQSNLNVFLELLGVGQSPVPGAAVGDEPRHGLRLVGSDVDAAHRRVPPHVLVVVLRK